MAVRPLADSGHYISYPGDLMLHYFVYAPTPSVLLTQYCSGDKMEENDMGGACSVYGREERRIQDFGEKT